MRSPEVETFYGKDGEYPTPYLTRCKFGDRLSLHVFHRGDADPDPHDHIRAFVTFPLTSYVEEVFDPVTGRQYFNLVRAWRFHYRPARYAHRVVGPWEGLWRGGRPLATCGGIVSVVLWIGRRRASWGFWVSKPGGFVGRVLVDWRTYIFGAAE